jgi:hypothetical protein
VSLILKRASASRPSGEWNDDDFDVLADGVAVGRIMKVHAAPEGSPWIWTLAFGHLKDRTPTHGYAATRGRDGGVRQELAAGVILVCAANRPIGENNSSLEMARVDERTLDNNSLRILLRCLRLDAVMGPAPSER